jgi:epsilon-lactone hydrolase
VDALERSHLRVAHAMNLPSAGSDRPVVDRDGSIHIPRFSVPLSRYMSEQAKRHLIQEALNPGLEQAVRLRISAVANASITEVRAGADDFYRPIVERSKALYPVDIEEQIIGGVGTQIVTPKSGVSADNCTRVLINLHGGGFVLGAGLGGLAESIPVSGLGRFKVISVDYRQAPEHSFPAASEDVASVFTELLKQYPAKNIGIYGCSAGGILSAMTAAWLQKKNSPAPGAIGIFSAGALGSFDGPPGDPNTWGGDSRFTAPPLVGQVPSPLRGVQLGAMSGAMNYTGGADPNDPLVSPGLSPEILARFPPTLLITGTRSYDMSAAVQTHRELTKAGAEARLHLWDGLGHGFLLYADLPESKEAYAVITSFFDSSLGRSVDPKSYAP